MASWTEQSLDSLAAGEPWTTSKAIAAFENPKAIAEGAAGAPKIKTAAFQNNSVNENAMKVQEFTESGTIGANSTVKITLAGNLIFFPRVSGGALGGVPIQGYMSDGQLILQNLEDASATYEVSWYRIVP